MPGKFNAKNIHHISWAVNDADATIQTWSKLFGIGPWTYHDLSGTDAKGRPWRARAFHAQFGGVTMEMVQPIEGRIIQSKFLDTHGPGVHHIGFQVDDLDGAIEYLVANGARVTVKNPGNFAYLESGAPDGVMYELQLKTSHMLDDSQPYKPGMGK